MQDTLLSKEFERTLCKKIFPRNVNAQIRLFLLDNTIFGFVSSDDNELPDELYFILFDPHDITCIRKWKCTTRGMKNFWFYQTGVYQGFGDNKTLIFGCDYIGEDDDGIEYYEYDFPPKFLENVDEGFCLSGFINDYAQRIRIPENN